MAVAAAAGLQRSDRLINGNDLWPPPALLLMKVSKTHSGIFERWDRVTSRCLFSLLTQATHLKPP